MLAVLLFLLLFGEIGALDPLFNHVVQLTFDGDHSFPSFSRDGRAIFFTAKDGPYSKCEHVYRIDRGKPTNPMSLISTGIGREFQSTQIGDRYATVSTALKELESITTDYDELESIAVDGYEHLETSTEMFCPVSVCKAQEDEQVRDVCAKPHLERLLGSAVLRLLDSGVLTDLNYQDDFEDGWVNNEAMHEENEESFGRVFSARCPEGECIIMEDQLGARTANEKQGWWDGFTQRGALTSESDDIELAFVGTSVDDFALEQGIIPINGSKIYKTTFKTMGSHRNIEPLVDDPNFAFMHPTFDPTNGDIIATRIDLGDHARTLVRISDNGEVQEMPDDSADYFHGSMSTDGKEIVFISNRDGKGNQIYLGSIADSKNKEFKTKPFIPVPSPSKHFFETQNYCIMTNDEVSVQPKLSADGEWLMYGMAFTINSCNQIFQIYLPNNDTSMPRKMTSGMHFFDSHSFLGPSGTNDILYSGTLARSVNMDNVDLSCRIRKCYFENTEEDEKLRDACAHVGIEKGLPKESDLYIADQLGHIKKRLTTTELYTGEATVSSDFKTVVFSREIPDDYELFQMDIDDGSMKQLTMTLGFEGGPVLSADGHYLAFYAWRPNTTDELERFVHMKNYGFTDIQRTELFLYDMKDGWEISIYDSCVRCHSPAFLPSNDKLLFINELDNKTKLLMAMDLRNFKNGSTPKITTLETLEHSISELSFSSNSSTLVFVSHPLRSVQEITIAKFVEQTSGVALHFSLLSSFLLAILLTFGF